MKLLVTAFEAFGGNDLNSSLEVLKRIDADIKVELPVSYKRARIELKKAIDQYQPDFVLCMGQAGGETRVRIEKFGLNYTRSTIADNDGVIKEEGKITDGPLAYESNLHVEDMVKELSKIGPTYISLSAGGYICNTTYYSALEFMNQNALFIHLPFYTGQNEEKNHLDLDLMVESINNAIKYIKKIDKKR